MALKWINGQLVETQAAPATPAQRPAADKETAPGEEPKRADDDLDFTPPKRKNTRTSSKS